MVNATGHYRSNCVSEVGQDVSHPHVEDFDISIQSFLKLYVYHFLKLIVFPLLDIFLFCSYASFLIFHYNNDNNQP